jgi:hypothetical protein
MVTMATAKNGNAVFVLKFTVKIYQFYAISSINYKKEKGIKPESIPNKYICG